MAGTINKWGAELWSYMTAGDGDHCPLQNRCRFRRRGGWCISDNRELLEKLLGSNQFSPSNYDCMDYTQNVTSGRIFVLVETLANSVLRKGKVCGPPVPTELIFQACKECPPVEIRLVPLTTSRGAVWGLKDAWVVQLNQNDSLASRRFTLFHEVFHILAHCRAEPVFRKRGGKLGAFNELLAECFASCVLMPAEWVKEKWARVQDLDRMAAIFDVTQPQMWLRLKQLKLNPPDNLDSF